MKSLINEHARKEVILLSTGAMTMLRDRSMIAVLGFIPRQLSTFQKTRRTALSSSKLCGSCASNDEWHRYVTATRCEKSIYVNCISVACVYWTDSIVISLLLLSMVFERANCCAGRPEMRALLELWYCACQAYDDLEPAGIETRKNEEGNSI